MLVQILKTATPTSHQPTSPPSTPAKLDLGFSSGQSTTSSLPSHRPSIRRCTSTRSSTSLCQPMMEATKALAQKWKRKSSSLSLRRTSSKDSTRSTKSTKSTKKEAKAAADEARAQAERTSLSLQTPASRRDSDKTPKTTAPPVSKPANPPLVVVPPPTTLETPPSNPSPASDVSPGTQEKPQRASSQAKLDKSPLSPTTDYFTLHQLESPTPPGSAPPNRISFSIPNKQDVGGTGQVRSDRPESQDEFESAVSSATRSTAVSPRDSLSGDDGATDAGRSSIASFNDGRTRGSSSSRHRDSSPSVVSNSRFRKHVNFSNVDLGEITKSNFPCYTQIVRHLGYAAIRRSRTFMVGIDDHQYSDEALHWLFDKFADDGDEIVCVKVLEKDVKMFEKDVKASEAERKLKDFQKEANAEVERIKTICGDKAISIVFEYGIGKLHSTFQRLIQLHQPSMLIVGTRGRTLGGFQGLVASRNSFSKYCLQYSPVPVVVVRPDEKRQKKKEKRDTDPEKQSYRQMLQSNQGIHEADMDTASAWEIESKLSADEEAGKVARALGLPAKFDPTLKPYKFARGRSSLSVSTSLGDAEPVRLVADPGVTPTASAANSEDDGDASGYEDDGDFEAESGAKIRDRELRAQLEAEQEEKEKKDRLHKMEMGEGAALSHKPTELESDGEDDDDEDGGAPAKTPSAE